MANVSLTEQMGAMAIIDELRHAKLEVQKHLDLPARRKAVAEKIRAHYEAKGMTIDEHLVDEGVAQYFSSRLTHEPGSPGPIDKVLAGIYISRDKWLVPAGMAVSLAVAAILGGSFAIDRYEAYQLTAYGQNVLEHQERSQSLLSHLEKMGARASAITALQDEPVPASALAKVSTAQALAPTVAAMAKTVLPGFTTAENLDQHLQVMEAAEKQLRSAQSELNHGNRLLDEAEILIHANRRLASITSSPDFPMAMKLEKVQQALTSANLALASGTSDAPGQASAAVSTLANAVGAYQLLKPVKAKLLQLQQSVEAMNLTPEDQGQFKPLFTKAHAAVQALNERDASEALDEVTRLQAYAATPLELNVVSRVGQKSMVERNYDPSGGKTWYLLTEATDSAGNIVSVPVTSADTGRKKLAKAFGIRVSQEQYRAAYADKKADGHVDDHAMGHKQANALSLSFERAVIGKPDMITEW